MFNKNIISSLLSLFLNDNASWPNSSCLPTAWNSLWLIIRKMPNTKIKHVHDTVRKRVKFIHSNLTGSWKIKIMLHNWRSWATNVCHSSQMLPSGLEWSFNPLSLKICRDSRFECRETLLAYDICIENKMEMQKHNEIDHMLQCLTKTKDYAMFPTQICQESRLDSCLII
jgi:hypothetical protein